MEYPRIISDPNICGGAPVFKGTRVLLRTILASLAEGDDPQELLKDFPTITMDDIRAAIAQPNRKRGLRCSGDDLEHGTLAGHFKSRTGKKWP
ncbi:MAG: DUF433 domain-containing protein [Magnetococcales bacterium]|nr:DUF433 domain-containing protein [Magnetococcales bacterium]